jgi:hypothetical protein
MRRRSAVIQCKSMGDGGQLAPFMMWSVGTISTSASGGILEGILHITVDNPCAYISLTSRLSTSLLPSKKLISDDRGSPHVPAASWSRSPSYAVACVGAGGVSAQDRLTDG